MQDDDWDDDDVDDPTDVWVPPDIKGRWIDTTNYDW